MFCRSSIVLGERIPIRDVFIKKVKESRYKAMPRLNQYDGPVTDLLNTSHELGIMGHLLDFVNGK